MESEERLMTGRSTGLEDNGRKEEVDNWNNEQYSHSLHLPHSLILSDQ